MRSPLPSPTHRSDRQASACSSGQRLLFFLLLSDQPLLSTMNACTHAPRSYAIRRHRVLSSNPARPSSCEPCPAQSHNVGSSEQYTLWFGSPPARCGHRLGKCTKPTMPALPARRCQILFLQSDPERAIPIDREVWTVPVQPAKAHTHGGSMGKEHRRDVHHVSSRQGRRIASSRLTLTVASLGDDDDQAPSRVPSGPECSPRST